MTGGGPVHRLMTRGGIALLLLAACNTGGRPPGPADASPDALALPEPGEGPEPRPGMVWIPGGVLLAGTPLDRLPRVADEEIDVTEVEVGLTDQAQGVVQIANGLAESDRVVVGNVGLLGDGMKVRMAGQGGGRGGRGGGRGGQGGQAGQGAAKSR